MVQALRRSADHADADHDARWGVLQCMRMLVDEAKALNLSATASALERAIQVGQLESGFRPPSNVRH